MLGFLQEVPIQVSALNKLAFCTLFQLSGVTRQVGDALLLERSSGRVVSLGIAPWGIVENNYELIGLNRDVPFHSISSPRYKHLILFAILFRKSTFIKYSTFQYVKYINRPLWGYILPIVSKEVCL